ncbi:MAG TPA: FxsA family protein [Solirubrobacteraceae bacterium]|nr:FxsA family protein [Solirubrobacteraceae bacterium]
MFALLLLILWPIAELFVAIKVAEAIGVLFTVILLLAGWPIGMWLTKAEGRAAWRRLSAAVAAGRPPGREVIDGALVLAGGFLIMVPGFITDVVGLALLAPTRKLAREVIARNFQSRLVVAATRFSREPRSSYDVESTATDLDGPQLHR